MWLTMRFGCVVRIEWKTPFSLLWLFARYKRIGQVAPITIPMPRSSFNMDSMCCKVEDNAMTILRCVCSIVMVRDRHSNATGSHVVLSDFFLMTLVNGLDCRVGDACLKQGCVMHSQ